jgi:hypothetical protein
MIAFGAVEGFCFALSGMTDPSSFRSQMVFSKNILLKVFIGGVGTSMCVQALLALIAPKKFHDTRHYKYQSAGFLRVVGGCLLLGAGMTIAGTGPTMMPSQIGANVSSVGSMVAGALTGGLVFALAEEAGLISRRLDKPKEKRVLEDLVGGSYEQLALGAGASMLAGCYFFSQNIWPDRYDALPGSFVPPLVAGMVVGIAQIPLRLLNGGGQGGSRSIMNIIAAVTGGKLSGRFAITNVKQAGQLLYVWGGTLLGSYIACRMYNLSSPTGYSPAASFLGAALALFGSRMAGGCTCGHGITGFSELGLESMAGAAAIFGGGILTMMFSGLSV